MFKHYTAKYSKIPSGYMGQLIEWPEIVTEGKTFEDCRKALKDALHEMKIDPNKYHLIPVPDSPTHSVWVAQITSYSPPFDVVCSNDPLTKRLFKELNIPVEDVIFHKRETLSGTLVRRRMLSGGNWRELVPESVAGNIEKIDGVIRLRELSETDSPFGGEKSSKTL